MTRDLTAIGPYRIRARLASGSTGTTYLAASQGGRSVVVKVVDPKLAADPAFRTRLSDEIAAIRTVSGAFTAALLDADTDAETPWVATTYLKGPSLKEIITEGERLDTDALLRLGAGLAEALAAIHDTGHAHCDLLPSRVLLTADGPHILDFGISRAAGTAISSAAGQPGDVYSLGALVVYAATGAPPASPGAEGAAALPEPLRGIVAECLSVDPDLRPKARDLPVRFHPDHAAPTLLAPTLTDDPAYKPPAPAAQTEPAATQPPAADPGRRRFLITAGKAGALAAALVAGGGSGWAVAGIKSRPKRPRTTVPHLRQLWTQPMAFLGGMQVHGSVLYCATDVGDGITAIDPATGRQLWHGSYHWPPSFDGNSGYTTDASPGGQNRIVAFKLSAGSTTWRATYDPNGPGGLPAKPATNASTDFSLGGARNGMVYGLVTLSQLGGSDKDTHALAAVAEGATTFSWTKPVGGSALVVPPTGDLILTYDKHALVQAYGLDGSPRWTYQSTEQKQDLSQIAQLLRSGNTIYTSLATTVNAIDAASGSARWSNPLAGGNSLAPYGGAVFAAADSGIYRLDASNGRTRWHSADGALEGAVLLGATAGLVFVALNEDPTKFSRAGVYALDADTGQRRWFLPTPVYGLSETINWSGATAGDRVFLNDGNTLTAFQITHT